MRCRPCVGCCTLPSCTPCVVLTPCACASFTASTKTAACTPPLPPCNSCPQSQHHVFRMYPHNFPPTPQALSSSAFLSLDLGTFLCPRWKRASYDEHGVDRPVDVAATKVTSLVAAAQAMQV